MGYETGAGGSILLPKWLDRTLEFAKLNRTDSLTQVSEKQKNKTGGRKVFCEGRVVVHNRSLGFDLGVYYNWGQGA